MPRRQNKPFPPNDRVMRMNFERGIAMCAQARRLLLAIAVDWRGRVANEWSAQYRGRLMNVVSVPHEIARPPAKVDIPSAWQGAEMKVNPDRWLISLAASEIAELEKAAESYLGSGREIADITEESFPLPNFGAHLEDLKTTLLHGLGFE